ncbi:MAG: hypothetical protein V4646_18990 [Pseudomonadota bacterium]
MSSVHEGLELVALNALPLAAVLADGAGLLAWANPVAGMSSSVLNTSPNNKNCSLKARESDALCIN